MIFGHTFNKGINIIIDDKETTVVVKGHPDFDYSRTVPKGGDTMKMAVVQHLEQKYKLRVGNLTAQEIIRELGSAIPYETLRSMKIRARLVSRNESEVKNISDKDVFEAINGIVAEISEAVMTAVRSMPADLLKEISREGISLSGSAVLKNMGEHLVNITGVPLNSKPT